MIEFTGLNVFAILVGWAINVLVGTFWYSPAGFGKLWSKLSGVDMMSIPKNEATRAISLVAFSGLLQVIILAIVLHSIGSTTALQGLLAGFVLWLGFTALTTIGNTLYQRLSLKFWLLNACYFLLVILANSVILSVWT